MKSPSKCPDCGSVIVCWNWIEVPDGDYGEPTHGHECWNCGTMFYTKKKVTNGVRYEYLLPLNKLQDELGRPLEWNSALEVLYGGESE